MADGTIRIDTALNNKPLEQGAKEAETIVDRAGKDIVNSAKGAEAQIEQMCAKGAAKIKEAAEEIIYAPDDSIKGLEKYVQKVTEARAKAAEELSGLTSDVESWKASFNADTAKATPEQKANYVEVMKAAGQDIEAAEAKQKALNDRIKEYDADIQAATGDIERMKAAEQAKADAANRAAGIKTAGAELTSNMAGYSYLDKIQTEQQYNTALAETQSRMAAIEAEAQRIAQAQGYTTQEVLATNREYQGLAQRQKLLVDNQGRFTGKVADTTKETQKATKETHKFGAAIGQGIKKIGKMALALVGIRAAYGAIRKAATAYMETNEQLSQQTQSIWNIVGQAVGPIIERVVSWLSTAITYVNAFIKAMSGIDLIAKANAAALTKQAKAGAAASKQLAGFDEMNKLNEQGGGGTQAATFTPTSVIDGVISAIQGAFENGKTFNLGAWLGDKITEWIDNIKWEDIGQKIGDFLADVVMFVIGLVLHIDPASIIKAIVDFATGLFNGISDVIAQQDWGQIGVDIIDWIIGGLLVPDLSKFIPSLFRLIGSLIGAIFKIIVGMATRIAEIGKAIWEAIVAAFDNIDWNDTPENIINGLLQGIGDALKGIGDWIVKNVWEPFKEGVCDAFGIHSPSKKMAEFGVMLIEGLKNGIGDIWGRIRNAFDVLSAKLQLAWFNLKEGAKTAAQNFVENFRQKFAAIADAVKAPLNAMISAVERAVNWIIDKINSISFTVPSWIPAIGGKKVGFTLNHVYIPRLAQGAIVNNPGHGVPAIVGEAGREAVLPLDHNTEWIDELADKIGGGNVTVPIYLDGKQIAKYMVNVQQKRAFAANGGN